MLEFRVLGALEVEKDGESVALHAQQRTLLATLLVNPGQVTPSDRIVETLWPAGPPRNVANAVHVAVSRLRKQLPENGNALIETRPHGYLLAITAEQVDAGRFRRLVAEGRRAMADGSPARADALLAEALGLWRGPALADLPSEGVLPLEAGHLEEERLSATEVWNEARLALGQHDHLVPALEQLVAEHPYREGFRAQLMLALYRSGRQAEALEAFQDARRRLVDELGIEPSRALQRLEHAILNQDPSLDHPVAAATALSAGRLEREIGVAADAAAIAREELLSVASEVADGVVELRATRARARAGTGSTGVPVCPYKGLAPFEREDALYFHGRERLLGDLIARLASSRFLCLAGPSGAGKSSLLRAGILAALADGVLPSSDTWRRVLVRPGATPTTTLVHALETAGDDAEQRVVVAVDQLEEMFTLCGDEGERQAFVDELARLAADPRHTLVATIRADFLADAAASPELTALLASGTALIGPPSRAELEAAIEGPAATAGLTVEPALTAALVAEAEGRPGALPLLQTALLELWQARDGTRMTLASHERTGGLRGAVARVAEGAYATLGPDEAEIARRVLLALAEDAGEGAVTRRHATRAELGADRDPEVARVLGTLADRRLVTLDGDGVDVAHEALFREWPRLREWLEEDAASRHLRRGLAAAAGAWDAGGRDEADLMRGARLASTLEWWRSSGGTLDPLDTAFLEASQAAAEAEELRQRRENRRLRVLLTGAGVLLLLALGAGAVALQQRDSASSASTEATAERLGAQALVQSDLDRSVLLAQQGVSLRDNPATQGNLFAALIRSPAAVHVSRPLPGRLLYLTGSPRGPRVLVGNNENTIGLVNPKTGRVVATVPGYGGGFSSDGRTAFVYDQDIAYLRATDGRKERRTPWPEPRRAAALSGDLSTLALVTEDGRRLDVWDVSRRPAARRWTVGASPRKQILEAVPSGDGRRVLVLEAPQGPSHDWGVGPSIRYAWWRIGATSPSRVVDVPSPYGPFATSPDLGRVAMGAPDGKTVWVVSEATGRRQAMAEGHLTPLVQGLALSRDGSLVATGGDDKAVIVSDARTGKLVTRLEGHAGRTFMPAFSGDDRTVYSVSLDSSLIAWDLAGPRSLAENHQAGAGNEDPDQWTIPAMDLSADGRLVAVAQLPSVVTVRRRDGFGIVRRLVLPAHVSTLDFSPNGRHLAVGDDKGGVAVFATDGWRRVAWIAAPPGLARGSTATAESVAFSPDGRTLGVAYRTDRAAGGSTDGGGMIVRYVPATGALAGPVIDAQAPAIALAWAPDGKAVAAVLDEFDPDVKPLLPPDGSLASWSLEDRKRLFLADVDGVGHGRPAFGLTYSPDGTLIAAGGGDGMLHLFRATDGKAAGRPLQASAGWNVSSAFSPDGRRLASGGTDGTVRLFDLASRSAVGRPLQLVGWVTVRFTPDGRTLVGASSPGGVTFLDVDPASWQRRACRLAGRTLTRDEWAQFMPGHAYAPACR